MHRNDILVFLLIFTILLSTLVSFFSFGNLFNNLPVRTIIITGNVPTDTGHINMTIAESINIDVDPMYNTLNFGSCTPGPTGLLVDLGNNVTDGMDNYNCSEDNGTPQFIVVHNIGNVDVNVTMQGECNVSDFIGSVNSALNLSSVACIGGDIINTSLLDEEFYICNNVSRSGTATSSFNVTASVWVTNDATGGIGACADFQNQMTFTARKI